MDTCLRTSKTSILVFFKLEDTWPINKRKKQKSLPRTVGKTLESQLFQSGRRQPSIIEPDYHHHGPDSRIIEHPPCPHDNTLDVNILHTSAITRLTLRPSRGKSPLLTPDF